MRAIVVEVINKSAIPERAAGTPLTDDVRLTNLGIDSLGVVIVFVELSTRTGLNFERHEGMAPLRTVGDVVDFGLQLANSGNDCQLADGVLNTSGPHENLLNAVPADGIPGISMTNHVAQAEDTCQSLIQSELL